MAATPSKCWSHTENEPVPEKDSGVRRGRAGDAAVATPAVGGASLFVILYATFQSSPSFHEYVQVPGNPANYASVKFDR